MKSLRRHEGYLLIDHRNSPGVSDELAATVGIPMRPGGGRGLFEAPTVTCSHCQVIVIVNPLRNRERAYCSKCDHYICDKCGVVYAQTRQCITFKEIVETVQERAVLAQQRGTIILPS